MSKESLQKRSIFYCGPEIWPAAQSQMWMDMTGCDAKGVAIMMEKDQIYPIYISNIYFGAGNILKQDMLSIGGDVVVHKYFINGKEERGDLVILGTAKQIRQLRIKMRTQHWGLKELSEEVKIVMDNLNRWRRKHDQDLLPPEDEENFLLPKMEEDFDAKKLVDQMLELPLHQAKDKGFIRLKGEVSREVFYAALSRGYYLEGEEA